MSNEPLSEQLLNEAILDMQIKNGWFKHNDYMDRAHLMMEREFIRRPEDTPFGRMLEDVDSSNIVIDYTEDGTFWRIDPKGTQL